MKRRVTISFEVDTSEYVGVVDNEEGALNLIQTMMVGQADFPDDAEYIIECGETGGEFSMEQMYSNYWNASGNSLDTEVDSCGDRVEKPGKEG